MSDIAPTAEIGTLDDYFDRVCEALQLTDTQFNSAENRYHEIGRWLTDRETHLDRLEPEVLPQGSMLQRTTIRPLRKDGDLVPFDLDSVCRCTVDPGRVSSQSVYGSILSRLQASEEYAERIRDAAEELRASGKCVRLSYSAQDFFLDVVPVCVDPTDPEGVRLLMPDPGRWHDAPRPLDTWRRTDPFRFAAWLEDRAAIVRRMDESKLVAGVAPVPPREAWRVKAPLRRIVQILKRKRDLDFLGDECRPTSIMLSTLAGRAYGGERSVADGLSTVLDNIAAQVRAAGSGRIVVLNPTDLIAPHDGGPEDFAKPLTDAAYSKFRQMIDDARGWLAVMAQPRKPSDFGEGLKRFAGPSVAGRVSATVQESIQRAGADGRLVVGAGVPALGVVGGVRAARGAEPVRPNTFHGDR